MYTQLTGVFALLLLAVLYGVAYAAPAPIVTSTQASEERPDNSFGIGFTASVAQRPFIAVSDQLTLLPYISYKYKKFYIESLDIGYSLFKNNTAKIDLLATPRFYEVKASFAKSGELDGIEQTNPTYLAGISAQVKTDFAVYTFQYFHDLLESDGNEGVITASKTFTVNEALTLIPSLGATYQDSKLVDYFYGVQASEVRPGRPLYDGKSSLNYNVALNAIYKWTKHVELLGQVKYEVLGGGITDSPIVDEDAVYSFTIGGVYRY